jgi:putative sigma-54 modulation protein
VVPDEAKPFVVEEEEEIETRIVRTKQFQMKPMGAEEAVLQLELLDHDFYVFTSADTGDVNVVYRRRDGDYGLIEPAR